jgi:hypothetical protein
MFGMASLLDIYTSDQLLDYPNMKELNPLLPDRPSKSRMLVHKLVLFPLLWRLNGTKFRDISSWELQILTGVTFAAISHNYRKKEDLDRISAKRGSQD